MLTPIQIEKIPPVSVEEFDKRFVRAGRPIVITGMINDWPAMKLWDMNYLISHFGDINTNTIKTDQGVTKPEIYSTTSLIKTPLKEAVTAISSMRDSDDRSAIISSIEGFPSSFNNDFIIPAYCKNGKFLRSTFFVGPEGMVTPMHQDMPENLYAMISGEKRITLFAPSSPVYPNSFFSKIPNFSRIDPEHPDLLIFPRFAKAQAYVTDLKAGELLFLPSFWWHHVRNLEPSIALNFWWDQGWKIPVAWAWRKYKKIRRV